LNNLVAIFWILVFLVFYTYAGYGMVTWLWIRIRGFFLNSSSAFSGDAFELPTLTLIIAAYNEEQILAENKFDMIISDNRMCVYSPKIPSYFITHQLRYSMPGYLYPFEMLTIPFNSFFHSKFEGLIVPDIDPKGDSKNLSGKLCRTNLNVTKRRVYYAGIFTSTKKMAVAEDLDYLAIVSGPEPQRTKLEEIVMKVVAGQEVTV